MDYFSGEPNLFTKLKIIVSSFFGILLCASSFRFPIQKNPQISSLLEEEEEEEGEETLPLSISGLKSLIRSEQQSVADGIIRRSNLLTHSSSSSSSSSCFPSIRSRNLLMDDLIGTESGVCLTSNSEEIEQKFPLSDDCCDFRTNRNNFTLRNQRCAIKKEFPPPIPSLAVQAGHYWPRSPWILTRYCSNRRLILKLERVTQHQFLESRRENGRLILNLVPIDDYRQDLQYFIEEEEEEEEEKKNVKSIEYGEDKESRDCEIGFKSFTYGGGEGGGGGGGIMFCGVNGKFEERHVAHGHFGSAPLRPMGTVM